jgi:hypothetical protein
MAEPIEQLEKGWPVVKQAPWHFLGAVVVCVALGWAVIYWHYTVVVQGKDSTIQSKDAVIESRDATIAAKEKSVEAIQATVTAKNDLITSLTNQYSKILAFQAQLDVTQTNLLEQEKKIDSVEYWVKNIFANAKSDEILGSDTNRVIFLPERGIAAFRLNAVPIDKSIRAMVSNPSIGQEPLLPNIYHQNNVIFTWFGGDWDKDWKDKKFSFEYINDARTTNLIHNIEHSGSNVVRLDGVQFKLPE